MRYFGPFKILKLIGTVAYQLELHSKAKIHPFFHVFVLKPCRTDPGSQRILFPLITTPEGPLIQPMTALDAHQVRLHNSWVPQVLV